MKIESYSMLNRRIAIAAITNTEFLSSIFHFWKDKYVDDKALKTIVRWCLDFFENTKKAPRRNIQNVFGEQKDADIDPDLLDDIERILGSLSKEFDQDDEINVPYLVKQTKNKLQLFSMKRLSQEIDSTLETGDVKKADELFESYQPITVLQTNEVNPFTDTQAIFNAFDQDHNILFNLPGPLGRLTRSQFLRDTFIAFMGREKIGKTWWLIELAIRAARNRRSVAFFQAGDLSLSQQIMRFCIRVSGRSNRIQYTGDFLLPVLDCFKNQTDDCDRKERTCDCGVVEEVRDGEPIYIPFEESQEIEYETCWNCKKGKGAVWWKPVHVKQLNAGEALVYGRRFSKMTGGRFKLSCHPALTLSVRDINHILTQWENHQGFVPDVIIIDYADILAPMNYKLNVRDQQNETWTNLRKLSQEKHCCVITATQADADSYTKRTLTMKNFSEDKRKHAHVTAMFGLNQTMEERSFSKIRVNAIHLREGDFNPSHCINVIQSLQTGKPVVASYY